MRRTLVLVGFAATALVANPEGAADRLAPIIG